MNPILEQNNLYGGLKPPKVGDLVEGTIIGSGRSAIYIDLGPWGTGIVLGREFYTARDEIKNLKRGDKVFAKVIDLENEEGYVELSLQGANKEIAWENLRKTKENKEPIMVKILGANKGGLLAEVSGISAFLPVSQLSSEHYPKVENADPGQILRELQKFIGKELKVYILNLNPREEKLILSEKAVETEKIKKLLEGYKVGDVVEGEITGIVDFGTFIKFKPKTVATQTVDLKEETEDKEEQALEGLIHISELDWQPIAKVEDVINVGQKVQAKIIKIEEDRVFLSLKALKPDPWEKMEHKKGDIVKGRVTKINLFGALVEIAPGIQGLCHVSEFGTRTKMEEALKIGQEYEFTILQLDSKEHKMILRFGTKAPDIPGDIIDAVTGG